MVITKDLLDSLTEQAKNNPRLRMHFDLRTSQKDNSQRILNAIEPGSEERIHRHMNSSETVVIIRGAVQELFYNEKGEVEQIIELKPNSDNVAVNIPVGQWHTVRSLESGTVIVAFKDGAYNPLGQSDIMRVE